MEDKKITGWVDEADIKKSTHPIHIKDNATGKCCGIHYTRFSTPWQGQPEITFGRDGAQQQPEMAVRSDDETIGTAPLTLMPVLNAIGEFTLHVAAMEREKVLIDGNGVKILEYHYQLYHGDTFQVGNSTFTVYFNYFKTPVRDFKDNQ